MLLYYHCWMFYNHFITTLYHILGLTYWHSAKEPVAVFASFFTSQNINIKRIPIATKLFVDFFLDQKTPSGPKKYRRSGPRRPQPTRARQGVPGAPWWVVPSSAPFRTASDAYKFSNIQKTLGSRRNTIPATPSSRTARSNLNTITEGFIFFIGASPMMRE